jgi:hypothetical protein
VYQNANQNVSKLKGKNKFSLKLHILRQIFAVLLPLALSIFPSSLIVT